MVKEASLRVLVIDDEKPLRRILKAALRPEGYRIFEAVDGQTGLDASVTAHPDLIILDWGLPDKNGIEMVREIRHRSAVPIFILSVDQQVTDKVAALDAGADDYLMKPFDAPELLARLRAVTRRWLPSSQEKIFKTGKLVFDFGRRLVKVQEKKVHLTPTEYDMLKVFILKAGEVVTHQQLFQGIWNKVEESGQLDHLLKVTISNLRNKIEPDPSHPAYILTEPGIGYRLNLGELPD